MLYERLGTRETLCSDVVTPTLGGHSCNITNKENHLRGIEANLFFWGRQNDIEMLRFKMET